MKALQLVSVVTVGIALAGPAPVHAGEGSADPAHLTSGRFVPGYRVLVVSIPNHLTKGQARRKVDHALAGLQRDYSFLLTIERKNWTGYRLWLRAHVLGQAAVGRIDVTRTHVDVRVVLPGNLAFLIEMAQPAILKAGTEMLARK